MAKKTSQSRITKDASIDGVVIQNPRKKRAKKKIGAAPGKVVAGHSPRIGSDCPGARIIGVKAKTSFDMIKIMRKGLTYRSVEKLGAELNVSIPELGRIVNIAPRTLNRRKDMGRLETDESERIYRLSALLEKAEDVLEGKDSAQRWLKTAKKALGGRTPLDYADTEIGSREVMDLLERIEYGVYS